MTTVIDSMEEYSLCRDTLASDPDEAVVIFLPSDHKAHPSNNRVSMVYYSVPGKSWVMGHHHNDLPKMGRVRDGDPDALTIDGSFWINHRSIHRDCSYFMDKPFFSQHYNRDQTAYHRQFRGLRNVNDAIPLTLHLSTFRKLENEMREAWKSVQDLWRPGTIDFYSRGIHHVLGQMEHHGMAVDVETFLEVYGGTPEDSRLQGEYVYTKYNPYTVTGRPSNAWEGINFAAIPKKTGHRRAFVSRWGSTGKLVNFDFRSFHLYLLGNYRNVTLPTEDVHTWLGQKYFGVDTLTPEQYDESKIRTFQHIYGQRDVEHMEGFKLFDEINDLRDFIWETYQNIGFVGSGIYGRPITVEEPSKNKVFNYWVQNLETEVMVDIMAEMFFGDSHPTLSSDPSALLRMDAVPILYTYDSVLFDCFGEDVPRLVQKIQEICDKSKYPVQIEVGDNYQDMKKYAPPL